MKKWVAIIGLLVVIALSVGVFTLLRSLDTIVEAAIEKYGSEITGTAVRVGSVEIMLTDGRGTIRGLTLANPSGFSSGSAFSLGEITLDIDPNSVTENPVVIDEVTVRAPQVAYELDANLGSNIQTILDNIERYAGSGGSSSGGGGDGGATGSAEGPEVRLVVKRFTFENGKVEADASAVGGEALKVKLPPLGMQNLGGSRGAPPGDIGSEVLEAYTKVVVKTVGKKQATKQLDKLIDDNLEGEEGKAAKKLLRGVLGD